MAASARLKVPGFGLPVNHFPAERFPVLIGDKHLDWAARTLTLRELCMLNLVIGTHQQARVVDESARPGHCAPMEGRGFGHGLGRVLEARRLHARHGGCLHCRAALQGRPVRGDGPHPRLRLLGVCHQVGSLGVAVSLAGSSRCRCAAGGRSGRRQGLAPGSDDKVLDLVHPSLYPLVYGRSRIIPDKRIRVDDALEHCGAGEVIAPPEVLKETPDSWFVEEEEGDDDPDYDDDGVHRISHAERICATALFYYDSYNVTDSHLAFRTAANAELLDEASNLEYKKYDWGSIARVFAIDPSLRNKSQELGGVPTLPGRALFFPNVYQHHVGPFRLADATRPGYRKILALFLADPAVPVISTSSVPPQQQAWWNEQLRGQRDSLVSRLPQEVLGMIMENVSDSAINDDEAKRLRAELMEERTRHRDKAEENLIFAEWDFCEH